MTVPLSQVISCAKRHSEILSDDQQMNRQESLFFWLEALYELGIPFSSWDTSDPANAIPVHIRDQIAGQVKVSYPCVLPIDGVPHIVWGDHIALEDGSVIPAITEHSGVIGIVALEHIDCTR